MISLKARIKLAIEKAKIKKEEIKCKRYDLLNKKYKNYCDYGICPNCAKDIKEDIDYTKNYSGRIYLVAIKCRHCGFEYLYGDGNSSNIKELEREQKKLKA